MPELDLSWIIVAVDRFDNRWVLDASPGFISAKILFEDGGEASENNIYVPADITMPGLYMIENIKIAEGGMVQSYDEPSFEPHEISGTWTLIASWPPKVSDD